MIWDQVGLNFSKKLNPTLSFEIHPGSPWDSSWIIWTTAIDTNAEETDESSEDPIAKATQFSTYQMQIQLQINQRKAKRHFKISKPTKRHFDNLIYLNQKTIIYKNFKNKIIWPPALPNVSKKLRKNFANFSENWKKSTKNDQKANRKKICKNF